MRTLCPHPRFAAALLSLLLLAGAARGQEPDLNLPQQVPDSSRPALADSAPAVQLPAVPLALPEAEPQEPEPDSSGEAVPLASPESTSVTTPVTPPESTSLAAPVAGPPPAPDTSTLPAPAGSLAVAPPGKPPEPAPGDSLRSLWDSEVAELEQGFSDQLRRFRDFFSFTHVLLTLLLLVITFLLVRLAAHVLERIARQHGRLAPLLYKLIPLLRYGLWLLATGLIIVLLLGQSVLAMMMIFFFAGLALALASQPLFRDFIAGIVLALERPFHVGSHIRVGEIHGKVKRLGMRSFEVETPSGAVVVLPNAEALRQAVVRMTPQTAESQVNVSLAAPEHLDLETALAMVYEAAAASPYVYHRRPIEVTLAEEAQDRPRLRIRAYALEARFERQLETDIVAAAHKAFRQKASGKSNR